MSDENQDGLNFNEPRHRRAPPSVFPERLETMATIQELNDLTQHIRRTLPDRKQLINMRPNEPAGMVEFDWHARHFIVTPTLNVFELKGQSLILTCSSILMQAALHTKDRNAKVIAQVIDTLRTAEESMRENQKDGLALLEAVKRSLLKLMGRQTLKTPARAALPP